MKNYYFEFITGSCKTELIEVATFMQPIYFAELINLSTLCFS
jgi:hypothetical protein